MSLPSTVAPIDPLWAAICVALTAALLLHAAAAKAGDLALFEQHLAAYGVPPRLLGSAARLLPAAEGLTVIALLSPWRGAGAALAAALLLLYAAAMAWQRLHGRVLDCGCGGAPLRVSWALVARNLVLAAIAAAAAVPVAQRGLGVADALVIAAAVVLGTLLYAAFNQVLRQGGALDPAALSR
jgi:hypothetical protein